MKVLITGGCGFLGSNLAASYLHEEAEVVVVDALFRRGSVANLVWLENQAASGQLHFVQVDLANAEDVMAVFRRHAPFDYVCHVGGQVAMTASLQDPSRDLQTNVLGTFNVLEAVRALSPEALIAYSSTNKVYGDLRNLTYKETDTRYFLPDYPQGLDESLPLDFSTPYGCSKGSADQYVRDWARVYGLKSVVFRHSSIYGGRQFSSFDQGWIGWFTSQAYLQKKQSNKNLDFKKFTISGTGKQVRDVLHSDDLITLYKKSYHAKDSLNGQIFNIGGGIENSLSILELFEKLSSLLSLDDLHYDKTPRRQSDQDFFVADVTKAKHILGWYPKICLNKGLEKAIDWAAKVADF